MYNFYPRSPCGERLGIGFLLVLLTLISIHALLAESDSHSNNSHFQHANFYPRSPCGERQLTNAHNSPNNQISIHALLAESDFLFYNNRRQGKRFLSTLSLRRATRSSCKGISYFLFLSTLSLRRATAPKGSVHDSKLISIHALLAESDTMISETVWLIIVFLSTLSLRRATQVKQTYRGKISISIHALLAESDF